MISDRRAAPQPVQVVAYDAAMQESWLRCRVLSFLHTGYYDDVVTAKPRYQEGVELVAIEGGQVVGLLDATLDGPDATLECIAVHPDRRRLGIGRALLDRGLARLTERGAGSLTAWTREDPGTLSWYTSLGFEETYRYLHAYVDEVDAVRDMVRTTPDWSAVLPRALFVQAEIDQEARLRGLFHRVYVCRSFRLRLAGPQAQGSPDPVTLRTVTDVLDGLRQD